MQISPAKSLQGVITVPGDKSISHRAIMCGAIARGVTEIDGFLMGQDCLSTIDCFQKLGIDIDILPNNRVKVYGKGLHGLQTPNDVLYTGNSGTTTRLMLGMLAGQDFNCTIDGDASIRKRPMDRVIIPLTQMGATIRGINESTLCPLTINGSPLFGSQYTLPVASAQIKSALLFASLYAEGDTSLLEPSKSRDHSELMLNYFGANITVDNLKIHSTSVSELTAQHVNVPGDISSAAYFMIAGLIVPNSEITIQNVGINPTRTGIIDVLTAMGGNIKIANIKVVNNEPIADITVKSSTLTATTIAGDIIPRLIDEIPVIAVAAAVAKGTTVIKDAQELKVKESNRIQTVVHELSKAGIEISETEGGMIINGGHPITGTHFESYHDHRIAMAMSVVAMVAEKDSVINGADVVDISFPNYFEILKSLRV